MPSSNYRLLTTLRLPLLSLMSDGMGLRGLVAGDARFDGGSPAAHMTRLAAIQAHKYFDSALGSAEPRRELAAKQAAPSSENLPEAAHVRRSLAVLDPASHVGLDGAAGQSELLAAAWGSADPACHIASGGIRQAEGRAERRTLCPMRGLRATSVRKAGEAQRPPPECDDIGERVGKVEVGQTGPLVPSRVGGMRQTRLVRTVCGTGIGGGLTSPATPVRKGTVHACQP